MIPLVSIIIPVYNGGIYIAETLDSVLSQTYDQWECIIVDDHSTDNSLEIIKSYCIKYPAKFFHFTNPEKGACAARNYAFEKSKGNYIQYLDADDLLSPNKIESQLQLFQQYENNIIANCQWGRFYQSANDVTWEKQPIDKDYDNPINWLCDSWMGKGMAQTSTWLTPRCLIEQADKWNESLLINQDGEFFCRVLLKAKEIKFCDEAKVYYRSGNSSSISQANTLSSLKAQSLLLSYKSYERILSVNDHTILRHALGQNYLSFIYRYHNLFPVLANEAKINFFNLGFNKMWPVGGRTFKLLATLIGFRTALKVKFLLKNN